MARSRSCSAAGGPDHRHRRPSDRHILVQRRLSLLGDGLGHLAVAGVGLAFLTGAAPLPMAIIICVLGSIGIELMRESGRATGDVGLAILFYGGLSGGLLLAGLAGQGAGTLSAYLFGSLLTVSAADLWAIAGLGIVVLLVTVGLLPQLFAVCADEPSPVRSVCRCTAEHPRGQPRRRNGDGFHADCRTAAGGADGGARLPRTRW